MSEAVTVEVCKKFHYQVCAKLEAHDARAKQMEEQLAIIAKAQTFQAESISAQAASQLKTAAHLEQASEALELAAKTVAANSAWQSWAQETISHNQNHVFKENWKLIVTLCAALAFLVGLKAYGVVP